MLSTYFRTFCLLITLLYLTVTPLKAQTFDWAVSGGSTLFNEILCIDAGSDGNLYAAGFTIAPIVTTDTLSGTDTIFVVTDTLFTPDIQLLSYDPNGNFLWSKTISGTGNDYASHLATTTNGNFYASGTFTDTLYFGSATLGTKGNTDTDVFAALFDPDGLQQWAAQISGSGSASSAALAADANGNALLGINYADTLILHADTLANTANSNCIVVKYNPLGEVQWYKTGSSSANISLTGLSTDATGSVYACGYYTGTMSFAGIIISTTDEIDAFVAKLNPDGSIAWLKTLAATQNQSFTGISNGPNNVLYLSGQFNENFALDNDTIYAIGGNTAFVARYLPDDGTLQWITTTGGQGITTPKQLRTDAQGNAWLTGNFTQSIIAYPDTIAAQGAEDLFLVKINPNGNKQWLYVSGGTYAETANALTFDAQNNLYLAGGFDTETLFSGNALISQGSNDYFIAKIGVSEVTAVQPLLPAVNTQSALAVQVYPNPANSVANVVLPQTTEPLYLTLADLQGKIWLQQSTTGGQTLSLPVANLPKGMYLLHIAGQTQSAVAKLMLW